MNAYNSKEVPSILKPFTQEVHDKSEYLLLEEVVEQSNMRKAAKRVHSNKGAAGVDAMQTKELQEYLNEHWQTLKKQLIEGTYQPLPVRRVEIPKAGGGRRPLGIPVVIDRLIQQAMLQVLTPIFEKEFSNSSYGFRPERSAKQAVIQARAYIDQGKTTVVDIDLEKFFDRVNHDILIRKIMLKIKDKRMIRLIRKYLSAGVMIGGCKLRTEEGTPQGGPLSPLLANIMLTDLDKELEARGHSFVRYADDCNIYVTSKRAGDRVFKSIKKFLETKLMLKINMEKSAVDKPWKRKFLGFSFYKRKAVEIRIAGFSVERFRARIREHTNRTKSMAMEVRIEKLNAYLIGWINYFAIARCKYMLIELDGWIRRRLRMCLLKQWKKIRTKWGNLMNLGIEKKWAADIAFSSKGCWRLANTAQINKALGLKYWKEQGLVSLLERYSEIQAII